mgnify:CR=1 FL=1
MARVKCLRMYSFCSHKRDPDCMVSFILTGDYSEEFIEIIYKHLEAYGQDVSGDGEVKFQFAKYWPGDPTRLFSEFTYADSMIFITDCAPLENISENFDADDLIDMMFDDGSIDIFKTLWEEGKNGEMELYTDNGGSYFLWGAKGSLKVGDKVVGFVTTGYPSPTLNKTVGLAIIDSEYAKIDNEIDIVIRKKESSY